MVVQTINYYRFDSKEWVNPETSAIEQYAEFIARYDLSTATTYFNFTTDIDFQPDNIVIRVQKNFFNNPTYNTTFSEGEIDPANAFVPTTNHVIIISKVPDVDSSESYTSDMIMGMVLNAADVSQTVVELTCQNMLKVLGDIQAGTDYYYNRSINTSREVIGATTWPSDDEPNRLQLYYEETPFTLESEQPTDFWARRRNSSAGFPSMNGGANQNYPFAIYLLSGTATGNGTITLNVQDATNPINTLTYTKTFKSGDTAEYIISKFGSISVGTEDVRVSTYNNGVILQSLDYLKNYVTDETLVNTPITFTGSYGTLEYDYIYIGKSGEAGKPPENGRMKISSLSERSHAPSELPFYAMNVYGFKNVVVDTQTTKYRDVFQGYSLSKIAWRMLQDVGWCREPFFEDMNPYVTDYDTSLVPINHTNYSSDGLYMDYDEIDLGDGVTRLKVPFLSSFDCKKQMMSYNFKTLSDTMGMFLNTNISPKVVNYIPEWDETVYNAPSYAIIDLYGFVDGDSSIVFNFPTIIAGVFTPTTVNINSWDGMTTKAIAAALEAAILEIPEVEDYYTIKRRGSRLYMETYDTTIATQMRPPYNNTFTASVTTSPPPTALNILITANAARIVDSERLAEKIYNLRQWGVYPGFHPKVNIRLAPNMRLSPPATEYELVYGGTTNRDSDGSIASIVSSPTWSLDTKDVINKVIVNYSAADISTNEQTSLVFPAPSVEYNYYALHLDGIVTGSEVSANLELTIDFGTSVNSANITSLLEVNSTAAEVANSFNQRVLNVNGYNFPIAASGGTIFILSNTETTQYFLDVNQVSFTLSTVDKLINDNKELVRTEPAIFADARDSQSKYGIKQLSMTLPEVTSINDTMTYISSIFKKYMRHKDRCVCEVSNPDKWHIPLFSYVHLIDYTNFDSGTETAPWYVEALFVKNATVNQDVVVSMEYADGSSVRTTIPILAGDTSTTIASKVANYNQGELAYYTVIVSGSKIDFLPKATVSQELKNLTIFGNQEDLGVLISISRNASFQKTQFKEKRLVLLRVEASSKVNTYTATFGQPMENVANIVNQLTGWVGDVEKSSNTSIDALSPDYTSLVISDWMLVGGGNNSVIIDGSTGTVEAVEIGAETIITNNFKAPGNLVCRLSGGSAYVGLVNTSGSSVKAMTMEHQDGKYYVMYSNSTNTYLYHSTGGAWSLTWSIAASSDYIDSCIYGSYIYVTYVSSGVVYIAKIKLSDGTIETSFGTSGIVTVYSPDIASNAKITVSNDIIHLAYLCDDRIVYHSTFSVNAISNTPLSTSDVMTTDALSIDVASCNGYVYLAVSYLRITHLNMEPFVAVCKKIDDSRTFMTSDGNYDALLSRDMSKVYLSTSGNNIILWGLSQQPEIYISSSPASSILEWTRTSLDTLGYHPYSATGAYIGVDSMSGNGYLTSVFTDANTTLKTYKISDISGAIKSSNFAEVFSEVVTPTSHMFTRALSASSSLTAYEHSLGVYVTFPTGSGLSGSTVVMSVYDSKDYMYDPTMLQSGVVYLPDDGVYSISWQIYRVTASPAGTAQLQYALSEISGDGGSGYLKGNHVGIHMSAGRPVSLQVNGTILDWDLSRAYLEIYIVSKD